jgi:hypothetical protein
MQVEEPVVLHKDLLVEVELVVVAIEEHLQEHLVEILEAMELSIEVVVVEAQVQVLLLCQVVPEVQELLY